MVRHVVMFRWIDEQQKSAVRQALAGLPAAVPEIAGYWFGDDLGLGHGNFDFAIVGDFADRAAFLRNALKPVHLATVAEHLRPLVRQRVAVQHGWTD